MEIFYNLWKSSTMEEILLINFKLLPKLILDPYKFDNNFRLIRQIPVFVFYKRFFSGKKKNKKVRCE